MAEPSQGEDGELRGRRWSNLSDTQVGEILEAVRDYRGDVTLELSAGRRIEGYVFSHEASGPSPHVMLLPTHGGARERVALDDVVAIEVTGDDKASGRSWRQWVERWEEARRLRARGIDPGEIEPVPPSLE